MRESVGSDLTQVLHVIMMGVLKGIITNKTLKGMLSDNTLLKATNPVSYTSSLYINM